MATNQGDSGMNFLIWLVSVVVSGVIFYNSGQNSTQTLIEQKDEKISSLNNRVVSLETQLAENTELDLDTSLDTVSEPDPVYEEPDTTCEITLCNDGTCSYSQGRGTCSWHGGVAQYY